jgi:hypothetical protein
MTYCSEKDRFSIALKLCFKEILAKAKNMSTVSYSDGGRSAGGEQNGFLGVVDTNSTVGIGGFLSRKGKYCLRKVARKCVVLHDIGPSVGIILS